ncbi:MAG: PilX N-terminal domain-containing pilus assembly protein [Granulosicoccus sp.]
MNSFTASKPARRNRRWTDSGGQSQHGSALMMAMLMIFMLSILGVSAMRGSTLEKRMAINSMQNSVTFQGAESASDLALNAASNLTTSFNAGLENVVEIDIDEVYSDVGMQSSAFLEYIGNQPAEGFSTGVNSVGFDSLLFVSTGVSDIEDVRTQSVVEQGAYRVVPTAN